MGEPREPAEVGARIRGALETYRHDSALKTVLTDSFMDRMATFGTVLALWGAKTNLTARPHDPDETAFHVVDSLMPLVLARGNSAEPLSEIFICGRRVLDFGSGAGFPGLILASACAASFTLVEARQKRASFLKVAAAEMELRNAEIRAARISPSTFVSTFDAVLSRASGPTPEFYSIAAHALVHGGIAVLYSSPSQRLDLAAAKSAGLSGYRRYRYAVRRGGGTVERMLATWSMPEKVH